MYILNIDDLFSFHGHKSCFDERNYSLFRCRLSVFGLKLLSDKLSEIILRINITNKKVLLLDCDNTLWGGVVGEDGIEKIELGQDGIGLAFLEFQKAIKQCKDIFIQKYNNMMREVSMKNYLFDTYGDLVVTDPEGYVAIDATGSAVKFVDRLEFSRANFAIDKDSKFKKN